MEFCQKCGGLMLPGKKERKAVLVCSSCGFTKSVDEDDLKVTEKVEHKDENIDLVDSEVEDKTLPLTDAECPKCGHKKAYYWTVQTRAGDEPETKFLKCENCKHIWRDYS